MNSLWTHKRGGSFCRLLLACLLAGSSLLWAHGSWAASLRGLQLWRTPDHTRLVFELSGPVEHKVLRLSNPDRVVIDLANTQLTATSISGLELANTPISHIRHGAQDKTGLRVVLDLTQPVQPRSYTLPASEQTGNRLVVDLYDRGSTEQQQPVKIVTEHASQKRKILVAIDAGHGGEDPGAIGPGRIKEKQVTLAVAKELKVLLDKMPGYEATLIRNGDYYVGLKQRRDLARKMQADLFVSIHADAFRNSSARGASVYALSQRGATSTSAAFLAKRENNADVIGGVNLNDKDNMLAGVLFDLSMTATLDASLQVGNHVLRSVGGMARLHSRQVEQAGFVVLKSPDIPSILVETGFISNPEESRQLVSQAYQQKIARAVYDGVTYYFQNNPPSGSYVAWQKQQQPNYYPSANEYRIAYGDTLSGIAARHRVSVAAIKQTNGLADNTIRIGQKLRIPAS